MAATVKELDDRIDALIDKLDSTSLSAETFRAKVDATISVARWAAVFVAGMAATGLFQLVSVANQAGQLQNSVAGVRESIAKQDAVIEQLRASVQAQQVIMAELRAAVQSQQAATAELETAAQAQQVVTTELKTAVQTQQAATAELKTAAQELRESSRRQDAALTKQNELLQAIAKDIAELKRNSKP